MAALKNLLWCIGGSITLAVGALAAPVLWSETSCRAENVDQTPPIHLTLPQDQRPEARTAFVVPEWEIVYAYEDMAHALSKGPAHGFNYWQSVSGFWSTLCSVRKEADRFGDPGADAKTTIYTIGVSFTLEMAMKAAYEESIGRITSKVFGSDTPQDAIEHDMAQAYGSFLHQTPWYLFPFDDWTQRLWDAPVDDFVRGWERRLALGAEWRAKAAYARLIADAVSSMAPDETSMRIHVTGMQPEAIATLPHARVLHDISGGLILDVDRYRHFTHTARHIALLGGDITEIAGNDDIFVSLLANGPADLPTSVRLLRRAQRQGDLPDRLLVAIKIPELAGFIRELDASSVEIEHIYDF